MMTYYDDYKLNNKLRVEWKKKKNNNNNNNNNINNNNK